MCIKTELEQLVAHKTFDSIGQLRAAIRIVTGDDVVFDKFGPPENGIVTIKRSPVGDDWSCDLVAKIAT